MTALLLVVAMLGAGWSTSLGYYDQLQCAASSPTSTYAGQCFVYRSPHSAYELEEDIWWYKPSSTKDMFYWSFLVGYVLPERRIAIPSRIGRFRVVSGYNGSLGEGEDEIDMQWNGYIVSLDFTRTDAQVQPPIELVRSIVQKALQAFNLGRETHQPIHAEDDVTSLAHVTGHLVALDAASRQALALAG